MRFTSTSLAEFASQLSASSWQPPLKSNSFHDIKDDTTDGVINLYCEDVNNYTLFTHYGNMKTGSFTVGDVSGVNYKSMTIIENTSCIVDTSLTVSNTEFAVHGSLELISGSKLILNRNATLILYSDSTLIIPDNVQIVIESGSQIKIYGMIDISIANMNSITSNDRIFVDTAAVINVTDIPYTAREYSLTDYAADLRDKDIGPYTQGEHTSDLSNIGYEWVSGDVLNKSHVIDMEVLWGESVLGDYKLSVLGTQNTEISNRQIIRSLTVSRNTVLNIVESFNGDTYIDPELYIGIVIGNTNECGSCICNGSIIVDGKNSKITIDRKGVLYIGEFGSVTLQNGASMISAYNETTVVLSIAGTLTVDTIDQLKGFKPENIVFSGNGKLVILNPDTGIPKVLWTTPNGIKHSELYRLFGDRLDHVEYHISKNNGIGIDEYFENYSVYMKDWYNGSRIEYAIQQGWIVWHDGAFIELYNAVDNSVSTDNTLYDAAKYFKHFNSDPKAMLQEVVNNLKYAGAGDILFRFVMSNSIYKEILMPLKSVTMNSIGNTPQSNSYTLNVDDSGDLFMKNKIADVSSNTIIQEDSVHTVLTPGNNTITLS